MQKRKSQKKKISRRERARRIIKLSKEGKIGKIVKPKRPYVDQMSEKYEGYYEEFLEKKCKKERELCKRYVKLEEKKGKHLTMEERGKIEMLHKMGYSPYQIGKIIDRASNTIRNELERGKAIVLIDDFERERYLPEKGQTIYERNRKRCKQSCKAEREEYQEFIKYVQKKVIEKKWSLDVARGRALKSGEFSKGQVVCTRTLYNYVDRGIIGIKNIDLPLRMKRKLTKPSQSRKHKKLVGRSIEERPKEIGEREEFGHWEIDTVIGIQERSPVLLTFTERYTRMEIIEKLNSKNAEEVMKGMQRILERMPQILIKSITTDNGSEFMSLWKLEQETGIPVYYAHPYSSFERPTNERNNREIRKYVPKGTNIRKYSEEQVQEIEKKVNATPRRMFEYETAEERFNHEVRRII